MTLALFAALVLSCQNSSQLAAGHDLIRDYPAVIDSSWVNMIVEVPAGSVDKWEINKGTGQLEWEVVDGKHRIVNYLGMPANYGFVPQTILDEKFGGDGDALDILALGPAFERGTLVPVRIIGILRMVDRGEQDDKVVAVAKGTVFENLTDIDELESQFPGVTEIIHHWFSNYKGQGLVQCHGFGDREEARVVLNAAIEAYRRNR